MGAQHTDGGAPTYSGILHIREGTVYDLLACGCNFSYALGCWLYFLNVSCGLH